MRILFIHRSKGRVSLCRCWVLHVSRPSSIVSSLSRRIQTIIKFNMPVRAARRIHRLGSRFCGSTCRPVVGAKHDRVGVSRLSECVIRNDVKGAMRLFDLQSMAHFPRSTYCYNALLMLLQSNERWSDFSRVRSCMRDSGVLPDESTVRAKAAASVSIRSLYASALAASPVYLKFSR